MPYRSRYPCGWPGCPEIIRDGRYCEEHSKQDQQQQDQDRPTAAARGYGARWRRLRGMVLHREPVCRDPFGIHAKNNEVVASSEVDHIIPLARGGTNKLINLQALCKSCHSKKTILLDGGLGREGGVKSLGRS